MASERIFKRRLSGSRDCSRNVQPAGAKKSRCFGMDWKKWTSEEVGVQLRDKGVTESVVSLFAENMISGDVLHHVTEARLEEMGIREIGTKLRLLEVLHQLTNSCLKTDGKVFNDSIHGHIELHPLLVDIIDTPQFQRLRYIKQVGGVYYVYPGTSHNRFEHSIGTCYLAGRLANALREKQADLKITDTDILCVQAAGLCHDLGHGPFSHLFDNLFMASIAPEKKWKHEKGSVDMLRHLLDSNKLRSQFLDKYGLTDVDITFIEEQITGPSGANEGSKTLSNGDLWPYKGRSKEKGFLYEIVSNKINGIDVDRWDYFARDCHHLGIRNNFDHERFMKFARVIDVDGKGNLQICTRDKEASNIFGMFFTRYMLYCSAYQHVTAMAVEVMISEALHKANDHLFVNGKDGLKMKLSEAVDDMEAYTHLTDYVYQQILLSTEEGLKPAKDILMRIEHRKLYRLVGNTVPLPDRYFKEQENEIAKQIASLGGARFPPEELVVKIVKQSFGATGSYPLDNVHFYAKEDPRKAVKICKEQVSNIILLNTTAEQQVRVYSKSDDIMEAAINAFSAWCKKQNLSEQNSSNSFNFESSPLRRPAAVHRAHPGSTASLSTEPRVALNFDMEHSERASI